MDQSSRSPPKPNDSGPELVPTDAPTGTVPPVGLAADAIAPPAEASAPEVRNSTHDESPHVPRRFAEAMSPPSHRVARTTSPATQRHGRYVVKWSALTFGHLVLWGLPYAARYSHPEAEISRQWLPFTVFDSYTEKNVAFACDTTIRPLREMWGAVCLPISVICAT